MTNFAHAKFHLGHEVGLRKVLLFGGISDTGEGFICLVPDARKNTLWQLIRHFVKPGSTLLTDGARVYRNICKDEGREYGFDFESYKTVNHRNGDYVHLDDDGQLVTTNAIENCWKDYMAILSNAYWYFYWRLYLQFPFKRLHELMGLRLKTFLRDIAPFYAGPFQ